MKTPDQQLLEQSWQRAWSNLRARPAVGLLEELMSSYKETHRAYHSLQHVQECLEKFSSALPLAQYPGEVEIALWFHDAVYELKGSSNEAQSAQWASLALAGAGVAPEAIARVHALIMATQHSTQPATPDECLLVDIDLSILGAPAERFQQYEQQVREEYAWVPGWLFRHKRKAILRSFLDRSPLYNTVHFSSLYEAQARTNLRQALS